MQPSTCALGVDETEDNHVEAETSADLPSLPQSTTMAEHVSPKGLAARSGVREAGNSAL